MNRRMRFTLAMVPVKHRARRLAIRSIDRFGDGMNKWLGHAIDRLNIDKCRRYDNAVTLREFILADDLFDLFDDEEDDNL